MITLKEYINGWSKISLGNGQHRHSDCDKFLRQFLLTWNSGDILSTTTNEVELREKIQKGEILLILYYNTSNIQVGQSGSISKFTKFSFSIRERNPWVGFTNIT